MVLSRLRPLVLGFSLTAGLSLGSIDALAEESREGHRVAQAAPTAGTGNPYDTYMRLGYAAAKRGDHQAAATYFRDALFYVPDDREATIAYWNERRAFHDQQAPADRTPTESAYDRFMRLGYDETHSRDYQSALINFRRALAERPDDYFASQAVRNVSVYIEGQKGRALPAIEAASMSVASGHFSGESAYDRYMRLGYAAAEERQFDQAAEYFRSALYERPNDRMATIAYWNQKHNLISNAGGQPARLDNATYDRLMRLGYDATERHHFGDALTHFKGALQAKPDDRYAAQAVRNVRTYLQR